MNHRYEIDYSHIQLYLDKAQTQEGFDDYLQEYIQSCSDHSSFINKAGIPPPWNETNSSSEKGGVSE